MSRESTNKQLRAWQERKWVGLERGGIVLMNAGRWESLSARKFKPSCSRAGWALNRDLDDPERLGDLGAVFLGANSLFGA